MKTLIIEDEKPAARRLQRMLESLELEIIETLHSVEAAIFWFKNNTHPDIIFLDIQLSDGLSFEIFEEVTISSAIIFTTAYDEYALKAFKLNSIDYLLKPIDSDELKQAITKFNSQKLPVKKVQMNFSELQKLLQLPTSNSYKKRFTTKVGQHLIMFTTDFIECFYSENKGTYIYTTENRSYPLDVTLEQLTNELDPQEFYRVNRKFFIHIKSIKDIISYTNSRLEIKLHRYTDSEIIVSRERVKNFKEWLEKN